MKIFTIHDQKADYYSQPFFAATTAAAIRTCEDATRNPDTQFATHPEDFLLFEIGEFDEQTAELTPIDPKNILRLSDFKETA